MSAIREVKFLQELRHPNVIEVRTHAIHSPITKRYALRNACLPCALSSPIENQLLDVFSHKANLNLVLEYLDTDLEAIIKDRSLLFQASDIKSWMAMTFKGLEFCHRNWVLHRVSSSLESCPD